MAECELSVLTRQCLSRRVADRGALSKEIAAWVDRRNEQEATVDWQFIPDKARIKLKKLYPVIQDWQGNRSNLHRASPLGICRKSTER